MLLKKGDVFGNLKVIRKTKGYVYKNKIIDFYFLCKCLCGKEKEIRKCNLLNGSTISCGCYHKKQSTIRAKKQFTKTGLLSDNKKPTKIYTTWVGIKRRCFDKNHIHYKNYGGRGITVCDDWLKFENFYRDMNDSMEKHIKYHGKKQTTIERIDNNRGYDLNNCKWATYKEQSLNKRA